MFFPAHFLFAENFVLRKYNYRSVCRKLAGAVGLDGVWKLTQNLDLCAQWVLPLKKQSVVSGLGFAEKYGDFSTTHPLILHFLKFALNSVLHE